jgi:CHASE3 domain sensor protein
MKNLKIGQKILVGFLIIVVLFTGIAIFQLFNITKLKNLEDESAKRSEDAIYLAEHSGLTKEASEIVAHAIINRAENEVRNLWLQHTKEVNKNFDRFDLMVDTDEEKEWLEEVKTNYELISNTVEKSIISFTF